MSDGTTFGVVACIVALIMASPLFTRAMRARSYGDGRGFLVNGAEALAIVLVGASLLVFPGFWEAIYDNTIGLAVD